MLPTVSTLKEFKVRLGIAAKETHWTRTMAISIFKYTYRSESLGTPPKVKPHAIPERHWNTVLYETEPMITTTDQKSRSDLPKQPWQMVTIEEQVLIDDSSFLELPVTIFLPERKKKDARNTKTNFIIHPPLQ